MAEVAIVIIGTALFLLFAYAVLRGVAMDDQMVRDEERALREWLERRDRK